MSPIRSVVMPWMADANRPGSVRASCSTFVRSICTAVPYGVPIVAGSAGAGAALEEGTGAAVPSSSQPLAVEV